MNEALPQRTNVPPARAAARSAPAWLPASLPALLAAISLVPTACGDRQDGTEAGAPATRSGTQRPPAPGGSDGGSPAPNDPQAMGLTPWYADFPFPVHLSPREPGKWYDRSRRQALEQVVQNLSGGCTYDAWKMAKDHFFAHAPEDAAPILVERIDRALLAQNHGELVENGLEAITRMQDPSLAPVILRALDQDRPGIRAKAMQALVTSGTKAAVEEAKRWYPVMDHAARLDWVRAARAQLGADAVPLFQAMLGEAAYRPLHDTILEETTKLPVEAAAAVVSPLWEKVGLGDARMTVALILHRAGDLRGTQTILDVMRNGSPAARSIAVRGAGAGGLDRVLDDVLKLSIHDDPQVRAAVALALRTQRGDNVERTLATLALDPVAEVRQPALLALRERGQRAMLDRLIEDVETASGTKLVEAMADLAAAQDGQAVPAMLARYREAPLAERRQFIRYMALTRTREAFPALRDVFLAEEQTFGARGDTTMTYAGEMMANLSAARDDLLRLCRELPREDYRRRAVMMRALGNIAGLQERPDAFSRQVYDFYRELVLAGDELPQIRLLALEYLRRDLRLDDAFAIKARLAAEAESMRKALNDFLFEFF